MQELQKILSSISLQHEQGHENDSKHSIIHSQTKNAFPLVKEYEDDVDFMKLNHGQIWQHQGEGQEACQSVGDGDDGWGQVQVDGRFGVLGESKSSEELEEELPEQNNFFKQHPNPHSSKPKTKKNQTPHKKLRHAQKPGKKKSSKPPKKPQRPEKPTITPLSQTATSETNPLSKTITLNNRYSSTNNYSMSNNDRQFQFLLVEEIRKNRELEAAVDRLGRENDWLRGIISELSPGRSSCYDRRSIEKKKVMAKFRANAESIAINQYNTSLQKSKDTIHKYSTKTIMTEPPKQKIAQLNNKVNKLQLMLNSVIRNQKQIEESKKSINRNYNFNQNGKMIKKKLKTQQNGSNQPKIL